MSLIRGLKKQNILLILVIVLFIISFSLNIYLLCKHNKTKCIPIYSYLQQPDQILKMESGIIEVNSEFKKGEDIEIKYSFDNSNFKELLEKYNIEKIAGNGSEFKKVKNLMDEFAGRLIHDSYYSKYDPSMNSLELLEYSLDNKNHGINCRAKAQILNEMCLALGIYSRKVWLMPNSIYDTECHVVNEIWDNELQKWIMFDITENMYWVDENKMPLSVLEIRNNIGNDIFCTPVHPSDSLTNLKKSRKDNCGNLLYIAKNMTYFEYMNCYSERESDGYYLMPSNVDRETDRFISIESVQKAPENK